MIDIHSTRHFWCSAPHVAIRKSENALQRVYRVQTLKDINYNEIYLIFDNYFVSVTSFCKFILEQQPLGRKRLQVIAKNCPQSFFFKKNVIVIIIVLVIALGELHS